MLNLLVRQISETLVHFYFLTQSVFFFLLLRLGNFCYCIFKFTDCFSSFPIILLSLSTEFFISFFVLSLLKFQFGSSSFIHLLRLPTYFPSFYFFILVSRILVIIYWNIFMTAALTALYFEHLLLSRCWHLLIAFSHSSWYSSGSWYNKWFSHDI